MRARLVGWLADIMVEATKEADAKRYAQFERLYAKQQELAVHLDGKDIEAVLLKHRRRNGGGRAV